MFHCLTDFLSIYIYFSARFIVPLLCTEEKDEEENTMIRHADDTIYPRFPPIKTRGSASRWIEKKEVYYKTNMKKYEDYLEGCIVRDCCPPRITKTRHPFC